MAPQNEQTVNDGSECYVTWTGIDINGNPYTPSSLQYRVDDLTNGVPVVALTALTPGQSVTVTLTSVQNTMNIKSSLRERRQVLFQVGIPGGSLRYDDTTYSLVRRIGTP